MNQLSVTIIGLRAAKRFHPLEGECHPAPFWVGIGPGKCAHPFGYWG